MNENNIDLAFRYETINTEHGMFDNYIDIVYILGTENNKEHVMDKINTYNIHKNIIIQYSINNNMNEAYYNVFLDALQHNYKNIIIFEDDFMFDYNINQFVVDDIGNFIKNNNYHIYHLGGLFHISVPSISMHLKSYYITSSHGVIYNRDYVYHYIKKYENGLKTANDKVWLDLNIIKYTYYKPLCYQKCQGLNIFNKVIESFNLNKNPSVCYKIFNIISLIISFHLIYLFLNHKFFFGLK